MMAIKKPLVSVVFLSYCQEQYVKESLQSVLELDYPNVEVIVSDDASDDGTVEIIKSVISGYAGDKKIIVSNNLINLGLVDNFNKCLSIASGDYVAVAAGDDISLSDRVSVAVAAFEDDSDLTMVAFSDRVINEMGCEVVSREVKKSDTVYQLKDLVGNRKCRVSGASRVFKRSLYEDFGPLSSSCPTEDTTFILRALIRGDILVLGRPGIFYRLHSDSLSSYHSLYKMDYEAIFSQYIFDVSCALKDKLRTYDELMGVLGWVIRNRRYRNFDKMIYLDKKNIGVVFFVLLSKDLLVREKISILLKHYVRNI